MADDPVLSAETTLLVNKLVSDQLEKERSAAKLSAEARVEIRKYLDELLTTESAEADARFKRWAALAGGAAAIILAFLSLVAWGVRQTTIEAAASAGRDAAIREVRSDGLIKVVQDQTVEVLKVAASAQAQLVLTNAKARSVEVDVEQLRSGIDRRRSDLGDLATRAAEVAKDTQEIQGLLRTYRTSTNDLVRGLIGDKDFIAMLGTQLQPIPAGIVTAFNQSTCPIGWQPYEQAVGRVVLGARGSTQSGSPDLGGPEAIRHGTMGGVWRHKLTVEELPPHTHGLTRLDSIQVAGAPNSDRIVPQLNLLGPRLTLTTDITGGNALLPPMFPFLALTMCVKQ